MAKKEIEYARNRFESLIGEKAPKIYVLLFNSNEELVSFNSNKIKLDGRGVLKWITQPAIKKMIEEKAKELEYSDRIGADCFLRSSLASSVLSHEAAHIFLINYVDDKILTSDSLLNKITSEKKSFYGHPLMPDWLDEAIAVYCEQEDLIRYRISFLKNRMQRLFSLDDKFLLERPELTNSQHNHKSGININSQNETIDIYYSQTIAFLLYLIEKEGTKFIKKLIQEHAIGKDFPTILQSTTALPRNYIDLEKDFINWLENYS